MKKKIPVLLFLLVIISNVCFAAAISPDRYQWLESNENRGVFFDTQTIKFAKNWNNEADTQIVDAWLYFTCNNGVIKANIEWRKKNGLSTDGWNNLTYYLEHYQFNFKTKQLKNLGFIAYDNQEKVLDSQSYSAAQWEDIIPGTAKEYWLEELEKYAITNELVLKLRTK